MADVSVRQRARRLPSEDAARAFDEKIANVSHTAGRADTAEHIYPYKTADGIRWPLSAAVATARRRRSAGSRASETNPDAGRRLAEQVERGEARHTKEISGGYFLSWIPTRLAQGRV